MKDYWSVVIVWYQCKFVMQVTYKFGTIFVAVENVVHLVII